MGIEGRNANTHNGRMECKYFLFKRFVNKTGRTMGIRERGSGRDFGGIKSDDCGRSRGLWYGIVSLCQTVFGFVFEGVRCQGLRGGVNQLIIISRYINGKGWLIYQLLRYFVFRSLLSVFLCHTHLNIFHNIYNFTFPIWNRLYF